MATNPHHRAWDANALIGWLGEEVDKQPECEQVVRAAERGEVQIVVSTLALVEVIKLKRGHEPIPLEAQERIEEYFQRSYITMRNLDPATAQLARELVWNHSIDSKDAVHVATALRASVDVLDTFDGGLIAKSGLVVPPYKPLTIARPRIPNEQQSLVVGEASAPEQAQPG